MRVPQETKDMLRVPLRHPVAFTLAIFPALASVVVGCYIYRPTLPLFAPLVMAGLLCLFLLEGIFSGKLTDNQGTAVRSENPIGFWGKVVIWFLGYAFIVAFPVGFALQERDREAECAKRGDIVPATPALPGA